MHCKESECPSIIVVQDNEKEGRTTWFDDFFLLCRHIHELRHFVIFVFSFKEHS